MAPIFATTDLARALAHYEHLGFEVEAYDGADYYGYACRDGIEIDFAKVDDLDGRTTTSSAYLWVDDAGALYDEWIAAGVEGRLRAPVSTSYGLEEGAHVDPDGNLIRFGSPPVATPAAALKLVLVRQRLGQWAGAAADIDEGRSHQAPRPVEPAVGGGRRSPGGQRRAGGDLEVLGPPSIARSVSQAEPPAGHRCSWRKLSASAATRCPVRPAR